MKKYATPPPFLANHIRPLSILLFATGVATQGQSMFDNWVTRYIMAFSLDGVHWEPLKDDKGLIKVS